MSQVAERPPQLHAVTAEEAAAHPAPPRPPAPRPGTPSGRTTPRRARHRKATTSQLRLIGRILTVAGVSVVLFLVYAFVLSRTAESRSQEVLSGEFRTAIQTGTLDQPNAPLTPGAPVAFLSIPRLGLSAVVVEGTSPQLTKEGPGHLHGTPLPGEYGNAVIAGRRATFGGPFHDLGKLAEGDTISVLTGQGLFQYRVVGVHAVGAGDPDLLGPSTDSRLTLVTSDPVLLATGRLVATAELVGYPAAVPQRPPVTVAQDELGLSGDTTGLLLFLLCVQLLVVAAFVAVRAARRYPWRVVYLVAAPVVLLLTWSAFENLARVLPGTL
jgi:LPXTG-site transpeptidase (sortase) family protein